MLPKELRKLVKKHNNKITHRQFSTALYRVNGYKVAFARLVEEDNKLFVDALITPVSCREVLSSYFIGFCRGLGGYDNVFRAGDGRLLKDRRKAIGAKTSTVLILYSYSYNNISRTLKVINRKEKAAGWGTTSVADLGEVEYYTKEPTKVPAVLLVASRNWLRSIPHLSLFILLLRLFSTHPIMPNETDKAYWEKLCTFNSPDSLWLKHFLELHPKILDLFLTNAKQITKEVNLTADNPHISFKDGVEKLTDEIKRALHPDDKIADKIYLTETNKCVGIEMAKLIAKDVNKE